MTIGARTAALSGGWKNPYITEGLIAMWDGEWNAGGGKHDASATTWKDLSGNGNDYPLYVGTGNAWGDKYIEHTAVLGVGGVGAGISVQDVPLTIEAVVIAHDKGSSVIVAGPQIIATSGCCIVKKDPYSFEWGYNLDTTSSMKDTICSLSSCRTSGYMNGVRLIGNSYDTWGFNGKISLMGDARSTNYQTTGKLYTVRLYDHELTEPQRLANYSVDAARFGLT